MRASRRVLTLSPRMLLCRLQRAAAAAHRLWHSSSARCPLAAGYQVVSVKTATSLGSECALGVDLSYGNVALFGQCTGISTPNSTFLSIYIDQYCGGEHSTGARAARQRTLQGGISGRGFEAALAACRASPHHLLSRLLSLPRPPRSHHHANQGQHVC